MGFYVTTPIYYVNAQPHLGHAYTTIAADVLARHMRQRGEEVFFLTGTDEHGEPVAQVAEREGVSPAELADRNVVHFKRMVEALNCTNDFFIRTTDSEHEAGVQRFMQGLYDRGDIYEGIYEGWYCPNCADFKTDQEILDGNLLPDPPDPARVGEARRTTSSGSPPTRSGSSACTPSSPDFVAPRIRYNEALSFITGGLQDVSVSRPNLKWGVHGPVGHRARSSTSGSTRCSTTTRRSSTAPARTCATASGRPTSRSSARTSSSSTPSSGRRC